MGKQLSFFRKLIFQLTELGIQVAKLQFLIEPVYECTAWDCFDCLCVCESGSDPPPPPPPPLSAAGIRLQMFN